MKVAKTPKDRPRLVAVLGRPISRDGMNRGVFFKSHNDEILYLQASTTTIEKATYAGKTLEEVLTKEPGRTPVYEGDSITITF